MRLFRQKRASMLIQGYISGEIASASLTNAIALVASIYRAASGSLCKVEIISDRSLRVLETS